MRYLFVIIVALFLSSAINAQVSVNLSLNLGSQPIWGPTGYDYAENYYLPDIDVWYNVPLHRFYYYEGGRWIYGLSLPSRFGNYDYYNSYKVVVNDRQPWIHDDNYRQKYSSYKGRHDQQPIRDSKDSKYFVNKNHPQHNTWVQQQKHVNGNQNGLNNGNNGKGNVKQNVSRQNVVKQNAPRQNAVKQNNNQGKQNNSKGNGNNKSNGNDKGNGKGK
jgi:hypothetical protein